MLYFLSCNYPVLLWRRTKWSFAVLYHRYHFKICLWTYTEELLSVGFLSVLFQCTIFHCTNSLYGILQMQVFMSWNLRIYDNVLHLTWTRHMAYCANIELLLQNWTFHVFSAYLFLVLHTKLYAKNKELSMAWQQFYTNTGSLDPSREPISNVAHCNMVYIQTILFI